VCGGGRGGRGSPSVVDTDLRGEAGFGPFQQPGGGGAGGAHACTLALCNRGGGGGGGSFATRGDDHHFLAWLGIPPGLPAVARGAGGPMCQTTHPTRLRAAAGALAFVDERPDNDFWGMGVDLRRTMRIAGELLVPRGGSGGGGGGDTGVRCPPNSLFHTDWRGAGGGGGGGAIIVQALGRIVVKHRGLISASGGHGGGGDTYGTNGNAGGGGGGSGGMVVLMASGIHIVAHGVAYADGLLASNQNGAYDFAIDADGGVGLRSPFQGNQVAGKYPGRGAPSSVAAFDVNPVGGFGGMGLVQLMTPPGDNLPEAAGGDGTLTRLDDAIFFYPDDRRLEQGLASANPHAANGPALRGLRKARYLGWRGLVDEHGVGRDDGGQAVTLPAQGHGEGDIRPSPVLLPVPFGAVSRVRSRWMHTGATARRPDPAGSEPAARTMVPLVDARDPTHPFTSLLPGPTYVFAGLSDAPGNGQGYVRYRQSRSGVEREVEAVLPTALAVAALDAEVTWRDEAAYRVDLHVPSVLLGPGAGRYVGYRASLIGGLGEPLASYRILAHDDRSLHLAATDGPPPARAVRSLQIQADFIGLRLVDGDVFGGSHREGGRSVPSANVRIGFAFHVAPSRPRISGGLDLDRVPRDPHAFLQTLDLRHPDVLRMVRELGKDGPATEGATAVQYDVLFNTSFSEAAPRRVGPPRADAPRPILEWLVLPFQF
jgi:hypothetical protein